MDKQTKTNYLIIIITLTIVLAVVGYRFIEVATENANLVYEVKGYTYYTVKSGDTLWQVAESIKSPNQDTRVVVRHILDLNMVENADNIRQGQGLALPLYWEYVKHLERR